MADKKDVKILVIEDSGFERNIIIKLLKKAGYKNITQVAYGEEGIEKFKTEKPDLVLLDLILPTIKGGDVLKMLKKLKKINPDSKVIVVTIVTQEDMGVCGKDCGEATLDKAIKLGISDWILKPQLKQRLISAVKKALG